MPSHYFFFTQHWKHLGTPASSSLVVFLCLWKLFFSFTSKFVYRIKRFWVWSGMLPKLQVTVPNINWALIKQCCRATAIMLVYTYKVLLLSSGTLISNLLLLAKCNPILCVTWHSTHAASPNILTAASRCCQNWKMTEVETINVTACKTLFLTFHNRSYSVYKM